MTHSRAMKKATAWVAEWKERRRLRALERERRARENALRDRGEWGYIPPGAVLMSKRSFRAIRVCLLVILTSNAIILAGQWPTVWSRYFVSQPQTIGVAAMTPPMAATSATQ